MNRAALKHLFILVTMGIILTPAGLYASDANSGRGLFSRFKPARTCIEHATHKHQKLLAQNNHFMNGERNAANNSTDNETWNLKDVDIRTLIGRVARETGKTFVLDPRVKAQVTLISNQHLSPDELYHVFISTLAVHGFAAVDQGNIVKIIREQDMRSAGGAVESAHTGYDRKVAPDEPIVKIIHINNLSVKEVIAALKPLVSRNSHIAAYAPSNNIIIADRAGNIDRISKIVRELDHGASDNAEAVSLRYASPTDIVEIISNLEKNNPSNHDNPLSLAADERTNTVLVSGSPGRRAHIRALIRQMDTPSKHNGNLHVVYLKYTRAQDIAPIVANIINDYEARNRANPNAPGASANSNAPVNNPTGRNAGSAPTAQGASNGDGFADGTAQFNALTQSDERPKSGAVTASVQWEETTNAIIVRASPSLFRVLRSVIAKLDIRRPQVLVEAIIAEINVDRLHSLGIEWNTGDDVRVGTRFPIDPVSTIMGPLGGSGSISNVANTFIPGSGLSLGYFRRGNLRALLRAFASDQSTNILSTPNIVTLDNEVATIKVGEKVPFATGQSNNDVSQGGVPFTSFEREEVGLALTIRPQITQSGAIKLQINHNLSNVIPGTASTGVGGNPTTSERVITTNVMVDDGETLVLGGLIRNDWVKGVSKVPLLGDIPFIGHFFRSDDKSAVKRNLMIFLRPVVMRDAKDGIRISNGKYDLMRQAQLDERRETIYPNEPSVLPQLQGPVDLPAPFHHL